MIEFTPVLYDLDSPILKPGDPFGHRIPIEKYINAGVNNITLDDDVDTDTYGTLNLTAATATIVEDAVVDLGTVSVTTLNVTTTTGNITQSAVNPEHFCGIGSTRGAAIHVSQEALRKSNPLFGVKELLVLFTEFGAIHFSSPFCVFFNNSRIRARPRRRAVATLPGGMRSTLPISEYRIPSM